jgi:hypothetical protein
MRTPSGNARGPVCFISGRYNALTFRRKER